MKEEQLYKNPIIFLSITNNPKLKRGLDDRWIDMFSYDEISQFDIGRSIESLSLLDIGEDGAQFLRVSIVFKPLRAFEVEPGELDERYTLHNRFCIS